MKKRSIKRRGKRHYGPKPIYDSDLFVYAPSLVAPILNPYIKLTNHNNDLVHAHLASPSVLALLLLSIRLAEDSTQSP